MCLGSMGLCQCHVVNGLSQFGSQQQLQNIGLGNYPYLNKPGSYQAELEQIARLYFTKSYKPIFPLPEPKMKITGKEYIVVSGTTIADVTPDLDAAKKRAGELAHSTQGTVYIFQPVLEIAPKRDVVETNITLGQ